MASPASAGVPRPGRVKSSYDSSSITVLEGLRRSASGPACTSVDVRARPAPPGVGGRGQLGRRGAGRLRRPHRGHPAGRRRRPGRRQRPRHARSTCTRPRSARPSRSSSPCCTRAGSSTARPTRCPAACTASAFPSSTRCRSRLEVEIDARRLRLEPAVRRPEAGRAARPKGDPTDEDAARPSRSGPTPAIFETTDVLLRDDQPPAAGDGVPEQGPDHRAARRARREGRRRGRRRGRRSRRPRPAAAGRRRSPTTTRAASRTSSGT